MKSSVCPGQVLLRLAPLFKGVTLPTKLGATTCRVRRLSLSLVRLAHSTTWDVELSIASLYLNRHNWIFREGRPRFDCGRCRGRWPSLAMRLAAGRRASDVMNTSYAKVKSRVEQSQIPHRWDSAECLEMERSGVNVVGAICFNMELPPVRIAPCVCVFCGK